MGGQANYPDWAIERKQRLQPMGTLFWAMCYWESEHLEEDEENMVGIVVYMERRLAEYFPQEVPFLMT